jgi:glutathione peroxidase-family protein
MRIKVLLFLVFFYSVTSFHVVGPLCKCRKFLSPVESQKNFIVPKTEAQLQRNGYLKIAQIFAGVAIALAPNRIANAESLQEIAFNQQGVKTPSRSVEKVDFNRIKLPINHENFPSKDFFGKATLVINMKLDDPQTVVQFPAIVEVYNKYSKDGLHVLVFPTEQGYFEPDDDETCRAKAKEYYGFGDFPRAVVFDKVDVLGPSANPLYTALTNQLVTPNGYGRITLNYEKFLLDSSGNPVRRYPRKYSTYDMESDIQSLLKSEQLPSEGPQFELYQKAWREAKREAIKSEYAFRYNYNYYTAPDSMYKYKPSQDASIGAIPDIPVPVVDGIKLEGTV